MKKYVLLLRRELRKEGTESPLFHYPKMNKEEIRKLLEELIMNTDRFIVDIRVSPSKLAVFIDKPEGITLDECASLSKQIVTRMENNPFLETHEVEVSSPGMDLPLMVPGQYLRRIGKEIAVSTKDGHDAKGVLQAADDESFEVLTVTERKENKKKVRIEELKKYHYNDIRETKLIINFKFK